MCDGEEEETMRVWGGECDGGGEAQEREAWVQRERQAAAAREEAERALLLERQRAEDLLRNVSGGDLGSRLEVWVSGSGCVVQARFGGFRLVRGMGGVVRACWRLGSTNRLCHRDHGCM